MLAKRYMAFKVRSRWMQIVRWALAAAILTSIWWHIDVWRFFSLAVFVRNAIC